MLDMTEGQVFRPLRSELYPFPLCMAVYGAMPDPDTALIAEARRHRLRGDELRDRADAENDWEEAERLRNRASVAYARAVAIAVDLTKDESHDER